MQQNFSVLSNGVSYVQIRYYNTTKYGPDTVYDLSDTAAGDMILFCSVPMEALETVDAEPAEPNMQMKECGKAHLGSPHLMNF